MDVATSLRYPPELAWMTTVDDGKLLAVWETTCVADTNIDVEIGSNAAVLAGKGRVI